MEWKSERNKHRHKYKSSFARSFHEQKIQETNKTGSSKNYDRSNLNRKYNVRENANDETEVSTQQQLEQTKLSVKNLNSREREILRKVEQKIGRSLNDKERIDAIEHIIYEPDRTMAWLEEESTDNAEQSVNNIPEANSNYTIESIPVEIQSLNSSVKAAKAIRKAVLYLPLKKENKLRALLTSKILATIAGILCILTVCQFLIASKIANLQLVLIIMALLAVAFLVWKASILFKDLIGFANVVNATTENDIDVSGKHLAGFISALDIHLVLSLFIESSNKH